MSKTQLSDKKKWLSIPRTLSEFGWHLQGFGLGLSFGVLAEYYCAQQAKEFFPYGMIFSFLPFGIILIGAKLVSLCDH
jgi:hypothetical protein